MLTSDSGQKAIAYLARRLKFISMIPAFLLILAAVAYRTTTGLAIISGSTWLSNFAPLAESSPIFCPSVRSGQMDSTA